MKVQSIASALPSLWLVVAVCARSLRGSDAVGMSFFGGYNMPLFSDLCSDYPLHLTLLERPYAGPLTPSYRAGVTSVRGILVPLMGSAWWFLSRLLVDRICDAQHFSGTNSRHCHSVDPRICTGSRTNFWPSMCAPSAGESTGLTQVGAAVREFRLHIDEQRTLLVEHGRAHLRGNAELFSRALTTPALSPQSAACVIVEVHMPSTSGPHSPIGIVLCPAFRMRNSTEGVHWGLSSWRACSRTTE